MSGALGELAASAKDNHDVLTLVSSLVWAKDHNNAECPAAKVATPEVIAEWLPKCPPEAIAQTGDRLTRAVNLLHLEPHAWTWKLRQDEKGPAAPFAFFGTRLLTAAEVGIVRERFGGMELRPELSYFVLISTGHREAWMQARELDPELPHPWAPIIRAWQSLPVPWRRTHALALVPKKQRERRGAVVDRFVRMPGIATAALFSPVATVAVDGLPMATPAPGAGGRTLRRLSAPPEHNGEGRLLAPAPRTLAGEAVDPVLCVLANMHLPDADPRSPLRSDVAALVGLSCALMAPADFSVADVGRFLSRQDRVRPETIARAQRAVQVGALIVYHGSKAFQMVRAVTDHGHVVIMPSDWFNGGHGIGAWRLSGSLCRARWAGAKEGGLRRMVEGIEAALAWSPPEQRRSRLPGCLTPFRKGGPGEDVRINWQRGIYLAGEPAPAARDREAALRRWQRRVADLIEAGYQVSRDGGPSAAGDTWEIIKRTREPAGIIVRASATMCEAARIAQNVERFEPFTLARLLARRDNR